MQQNKTVTRLGQYNIEEGDDLKITFGYTLRNTLFFLLIVVGWIVVIVGGMVELHIKHSENFIEDFVVFTIAMFLTLSFFTYLFTDRQKYILLFNEQGIKNVTVKGEVFIPWDKLVSYGKEYVTLKYGRAPYRIVIYLSTEELDHNFLKKISDVGFTNAKFYKDTSGLIVISLIFFWDEIDELNNNVQEINKIYEKIESYVKLHKTEP